MLVTILKAGFDTTLVYRLVYQYGGSVGHRCVMRTVIFYLYCWHWV